MVTNVIIIDDDESSLLISNNIVQSYCKKIYPILNPIDSIEIV